MADRTLSVKIKTEMQDALEGLKKFSNKLLVVSTAMAALEVASIKSAASYEKQKVAFENLLKSSDKATKLLKEIQDFSASTPFQFPDLVEGSKRLLAFGVSADKIIGKMRNLGNAAMGDTETMNRLVDAFGKMKAKGKATLEELNRFSEAGVPILQALADNYDVTTQSMLEMINKGKIGFEDIDAALTSLTTGTGQFSGLIEAQSQTFIGLFSTMKDNLNLLAQDFGNLFLPVLKDLIGQVTKVIQWFRSLDENTKRIIATIGTIAVVAGPVVFAIKSIAVALATMGAASGPIGIAIAAVGTLAAIFGTLVISSANTAHAMNTQKTRLDSLLGRYDSLKSKTNASEAEQAELKKTINDLAGILPDAALEFDKYGNAIDIARDKASQFSSKMLVNSLKLFEDDLKRKQLELNKVEKEIAFRQEVVNAWVEKEKKAWDIFDGKRKAEEDTLKKRKDLNKSYDKQIGLLNEISSLEKQIADINLSLDPKLKKQHEEELARIEKEKIEKERRLQAQKDADTALLAFKERTAELAEQLMIDQMSEEEKALYELENRHREQLEHKLDDETWYQEELKKIKEKYAKEKPEMAAGKKLAEDGSGNVGEKEDRKKRFLEEGFTSFFKEQVRERASLIGNFFAGYIADAQEVMGQLQGIATAKFQNEQIELDNEFNAKYSNLDKKYKAEQEYIKNTIKDEEKRKKALAKSDEEYTAAKEAIDNEYAAKNATLKTKEAKSEKRWAIANSIMNTAMGVTKALASLRFGLAAAVGIAGAIQTGIIASQPIPTFKNQGTMVTDGPQLFLAGDNPGGKETVKITHGKPDDEQPVFNIIVKIGEETIFNKITKAIENGQILIDANSLTTR